MLQFDANAHADTYVDARVNGPLVIQRVAHNPCIVAWTDVLLSAHQPFPRILRNAYTIVLMSVFSIS